MLKNLKNKKKKGFTLIEIIAVIAIIAILAAVLVPKVVGYMQEARKTEVLDQARKVVNAAESVKIKKGYSDTVSDAKAITAVVTESGGLLSTGDISKIDDATLSLTVSDCKDLLDPNKTFKVDNAGELTEKAQ